MKFFLTEKKFQRVLEDNKKELKEEFEKYKEVTNKKIELENIIDEKLKIFVLFARLLQGTFGGTRDRKYI